MKFSDMHLDSRTISALDSMNFVEPTEVQEKSLTPILAGEDVMVRSQTGTGKTAAFGIGLVEQIAASKGAKKGLVLAPTRELALQITKELRSIAAGHKFRVYAVYGGEEIGRQLALIARGFEIIVATPGRLIDHYKRKTLDLSVFNIVVRDEADRMLDMGFREDISKIMSAVNETRQTMLFSATLDRSVLDISRRYLQSPLLIELGEVGKKDDISEDVIKLPRREKFFKLTEILHQEPSSRVLIFVATQGATEYVGRKLRDQNISSDFLHGGMRQQKRERIMRDFHEGRFRVLVATDVASRGLHVDDVAHVINYDEARDSDTHLHRIGRTGRMGKKGKATTFIETDAFQQTRRMGRHPDSRGPRPVNRGFGNRPRQGRFGGRR